MATYNIKATYEYEGEVEADSPEEAEKLFLDDLNSYYMGTETYECEELATCSECDAVDSFSEPSPDFICDDCVAIASGEEEN